MHLIAVIGFIAFGLLALAVAVWHEWTWWKRRNWTRGKGVIVGISESYNDGVSYHPEIEFRGKEGFVRVTSKYGSGHQPKVGKSVDLLIDESENLAEELTTSNRTLFTIVPFVFGVVFIFIGMTVVPVDSAGSGMADRASESKSEGEESREQELEADQSVLPSISPGLADDPSGFPKAQGTIKTKKARKEYLSHYLADRSSPQNQYREGFRRYGAEFLPGIIEVVRSEKGSNKHHVDLLGAALSDFPEKDRETAALALVKLLDEADVALESKRGVLTMIEKLGSPARVIDDRLIAIWEKRQELGEASADALVGIRSKKTGEILAEKVKRRPDTFLLLDIAEIGEAAKGAGEEIARLLDHSDWDLRLGAARTIGYIGYRGADGRLVELLSEPSDVLLNFVAAESLGRLKADVAIKALTETAKTHWHPAVCDAARTAVEKIRSKADYERKFAEGNFPLDYFDFKDMGIELPRNYRIPAIAEASSLGEHVREDHELRQKLSYPSMIVNFGAFTKEYQEAEKDENVTYIQREGSTVERREKISQMPGVGLRVADGWLLAGNRGEWGGELVFKGDGGHFYKIMHENVDGLYQLGERTIAVAGIAHLTLNTGLVYELKLLEGKWKAERWRALPGAPQSLGKLESGEVMVATWGGGFVILSENGDFRMADEVPKAEPLPKGILPFSSGE